MHQAPCPARGDDEGGRGVQYPLEALLLPEVALDDLEEVVLE